MNAPPNAQELILALHSRGISIKSLAVECERDPSLLYQVAAGKRPGTNLLPTLTDIARTGFARHRPERRTRSDGQTARVRARRGEPATAPPPPKPVTPTPGRFSVIRSFLGGGGRTVRITAPKRSRVGRFDAKQATMQAMAEAAQEQRRVAFVVHYADGSSRGLGAKGGYRGNAAYTRAMGEWQDAFEWLSQEVEGIASYGPHTNEPIIGVDVTIFGEPDPLQPIPRELRSRPAKKAPAKKAPAKKAPAKKTPAKRAPAKRAAAPRKKPASDNTEGTQP